MIAAIGVATAFFAATIARRADRHQEGARLLDDLAARLHVRRAGRRRVRRGDLPPLHARVLQGLPVPRRGQRDPRARRRAGHPQDGRARAADSRSRSSTFAVATAAIAGIPPLAGFFSKDEILWFALREQPRRLAAALRAWPRHGAADGVLHVPAAVADVLRRARAWTPETEHHVHESPPSMTGVLVVLAVLSAVGGFLAVPHFLEPLLPLPDGAARARSTSRRRSLVVSVAHRVRRARAAPRSCSAATARAPNALRRRFAGAAPRALRQVLRRRGLRALSSGGRCTGSPTASSCGSATARSSTARCTASPRSGGARPACSRRVQTGNLHLYALLVLVGIVASLAWSWRHG